MNRLRRHAHAFLPAIPMHAGVLPSLPQVTGQRTLSVSGPSDWEARRQQSVELVDVKVWSRLVERVFGPRCQWLGAADRRVDRLGKEEDRKEVLFN